MKIKLMHPFSYLLFACAAVIPPSSMADKLSCYDNKLTDARTCYDPARLRETGGIRQSPLYIGGPNGLRDTGMSIHINCTSGVVHLKDRDGVSFAGGASNDNEALASLRRWICAETLGKKK